MKSETRLILIKSLHTLVCFIMAAAAVYILYAGIRGIFSAWWWVSIGLLVIESLVLMVNKWTCPLTPIAMKYTTLRTANFDIYLPAVVAKHNKLIFGTIFIVGLLLVVVNILV